MDLNSLFDFSNLSDPKVITVLVMGLFAVILLFLSKRIAAAVLDKKDPAADKKSEAYKEKLLNLTLVFKGIAAGFAVTACVISLI